MPPDNTTPPASGQQPDGHLGELAAGAAILLLLRHADQALRLEHRASRATTTPVRAAAVEVNQWVTRRWVQTTGGVDKSIDPIAWSRLAPELVQKLAAARPNPGPLLPDLTEQAYRLGARQASTALGETHQPSRVEAPDDLPDGTNLDRVVAARWDTAERLVSSTPVESFQDVTTVLAPTHAAVSDVDRDARTAINVAVNRASHDAAVDSGAELLWVAERDACVVCLALSGHVVGADKDFDADATFGDKTTPWWTPPGVTLLRPPRHPRCRCRCEPWLGHNGPPGSVDLPTALRREAQRSILRGFSLPSESEQVRVRAADRLLRRGSNLPKTVRAYARDAVKRGRFPTRTLPTGKETAA